MEGSDKSQKININSDDLNDEFAFNNNDFGQANTSYPRRGYMPCSNCGYGVKIESKGNNAFLAVLFITVILLVGGIIIYSFYFRPSPLLVPEQFSTIQAAIDAAEDGGIVEIVAGTYYEELDFKGKSISLKSVGPGSLVIKATTGISAKVKSLFGDYLLDAQGNQVEVDLLANKLIGIYFSASWCGPCRQFTPELVDVYNELINQNKPFEVILVSFDSDEMTTLQYMQEYNMDWLVVEYGSSEAEELKALFQVSGVPHLVIIDADGGVISENGRSEVGSYKSAAYDMWKK